MNELSVFLNNQGFMPHGHCFLWIPSLLWVNVISDSLVAIAYFTIPITLIYLIRKRNDIPFGWMFVAFGLFIVACGVTHIVDIWVIWNPDYWLSASIKAITAFASVVTAILLIKLIPTILMIPSPQQLEKVNQDLIARNMQLEEANKALETAHLQLLQSEKMASVGQLAAGIAHEINNPISFVNSNMSTLSNYVKTIFTFIEDVEVAAVNLSQTSDLSNKVIQLKKANDFKFLSEDINTLLKESIEGLKRVKDIVQALKDFAHVGKNEWEFADLHRGLDSTLTIASNEIKYKATVVKEFGNLPLIKCLPSQLNQVFMNLLVNAAYAIKQSGVITIRTGYENDWVWVEISDTGEGILPEHFNRIFEPFFTTKPVGSGTGLGLSLSYGIVNKHGGKIELVSTVGKGTSFTVRLPVNPPE